MDTLHDAPPAAPTLPSPTTPRRDKRGHFGRLVRNPFTTLALGLLVGVGIGGASKVPDSQPTAAPTVTRTVTVEVPAPTVTVTAEARTAEPAAAAPAPAAPAAPTWHKVIALSGTSEKRSGLFTLRDAETRLRYTTKAAGFFAVYVVEEGGSLQRDGGFPEVSSDRKGSDSTVLVKDQGRYYLDISSTVPWTVVIEQKY